MKFDNKTFQLKYEAWKNGADYWKDIRGINLGGDSLVKEPTPEERQEMDMKVQAILNAYDAGKDTGIADEITKPMPYDTPLSEEHPILHKYKGGKNDYINLFVNRMAPIVGQQLNRYGYANDSAFYNVMRLLAWESNYGRSDLARNKHNYGGVKLNGDTFRTYKDDLDFVEQYMRMMHNNYSNALNAKSTQDFAKALKDGKYYEASLGDYTNGLMGMKSVVKASLIHRKNHKDNYNYDVKLPDLIQDYEDAKNNSPIIIETPSTKQPQTINATVPTTLLGPNREELKQSMWKSILDLKLNMYDNITSSPLPNILLLLPLNNFGKDAYGQKFWQRRGKNLHFDEGKDPYLYPPTDYDFVQARDLGYEPGEDGHWPSRNYKTGRYLKSPVHPTLYKGIIADNSLGYYPYYQDGAIYTNTWRGNEPYTGIVENYILHRSKKKGAKK